MSLSMSIFHGVPINLDHLPEAETEMIIDEEGYSFNQISLVQLINCTFHLVFTKTIALSDVSLVTGWNPVNIADSAIEKMALPVLFDPDSASYKCLKPRSQLVQGYSDLYFESDSPESAMRMILMIKKPHGETQVILDDLTALTSIGNDFTVWFNSEIAFQNAKDDTGWEEADGALGLVFPLVEISQAILLSV